MSKSKRRNPYKNYKDEAKMILPKYMIDMVASTFLDASMSHANQMAAVVSVGAISVTELENYMNMVQACLKSFDAAMESTDGMATDAVKIFKDMDACPTKMYHMMDKVSSLTDKDKKNLDELHQSLSERDDDNDGASLSKVNRISIDATSTDDDIDEILKDVRQSLIEARDSSRDKAASSEASDESFFVDNSKEDSKLN